jgi:Leucine-rich repeat (LRR) protein
MSKPLGRIVNGRFDLSNRSLTSDDLSTIPVLPELRELILSNNNIESFAALAVQPNLREIVADRNPVRYLDGLSQQPALESLDLAETGIDGHAQFRELTVAAVGAKLKRINGEPVTAQERDAGAALAEKQSGEAFLAPPAPADAAVDPKILAVWLKAHRHRLAPFGYNRAVALDLGASGPLPVVDGASNEEDLVRAIDSLRDRNERLKDIIREKSDELGVDPPYF